MAYAGTWQALMRQRAPASVPPDESHDSQGSRDVPTGTRQVSPPTPYGSLVEAGWGDWSYDQTGNFTPLPDAYLDTADLLTTSRSEDGPPTRDTQTEVEKYRDVTAPPPYGDQENVNLRQSEPLGTFIPDSARRAGFSALPETNSFARTAREWMYRWHRTRYQATVRRDEAPYWKNPAESVVDQPPQGQNIYSLLQMFGNYQPRDASTTEYNPPSSPAGESQLTPNVRGYEDTSNVVVHLG